MTDRDPYTVHNFVTGEDFGSYDTDDEALAKVYELIADGANPRHITIGHVTYGVLTQEEADALWEDCDIKRDDA